MSSERRVALQPAFILHRKPYRDTSLLLEIFSCQYGRIGLVARGAQGKRSSLKALLQPFQPLLVSWSGRGELQTMTGAEADGSALSLNAEALLSGFYLNELLMRLLHRHDPHIELYNSYRRALAELAGGEGQERTLRLFERDLLQELGYGLQLSHSTEGIALDAAQRYCYNFEHGPSPVGDEECGGIMLHGATLLALAEEWPAGSEWLNEAKKLMRAVLQRYLGERPLATRELYRAQYNRQAYKHNSETDEE